MDSLDLNLIWFILIVLMFTGYAILDGFDLGVGILYLFTKEERSRRILMNSIGPIWNGNEVWLIASIGALFAAFPIAYASIFSAFYLPLLVILIALIFRAASIEFRSKLTFFWWRTLWDCGFGISSLLVSFLFGVAAGNIAAGIPIDAHGNFRGSFWELLNVSSLISGGLAILLFTLHAALYLSMKTGGRLKERMSAAVPWLWSLVLIVYLANLRLVFAHSLALLDNLWANPMGPILAAVISISALGLIGFTVFRQMTYAFLSSIMLIGSIIGLLGVSLYPRILPSSIDPAFSLTAYNAASSSKTLFVIFVVALIGMPIVIAYTFYVYWVFRGKVELNEESY